MLKIFTDGGSRGNPGPAASAFVVIRGGVELFKDSKFLGDATNNTAEYQALLMAFEWLSANMYIYANQKLLFFLDSELVVKQMTGVYKIKDKNLQTLSKKIFNIKKLFSSKVTFIAVRRELNTRADFLVNECLDENIS